MSANSTSNLTATSPLEVRTGFFSICVLQAPSPWLCSSDTAILLRQFGGVTTDPAGVLQLSISFKNDIISSSMIIISLIFVCIAFLSRNRGRHVTDDLFQGEPEFSGYVIPYGGFYGTLTIQAICASTLASLLAIIWQHVTAVSTTAIVRSMAGNRISGSIGLGAMILGWFTFGLLAVIVISLSTSIRISIRLVQAEESPVEE
ncbi:hypothetical protein MMC13_000506 [Lambiella insularis]|nr:hypothetical protein [Lambiella insularis]